MANLVGHLLRDFIIPVRVVPKNLHIDGRRQTKIQYLADDIRRLKEEVHSREHPRQFFAQFLHVLLSGMMMLCIQRDKNLRVRRANRATRAVRGIDAAIRKTDIIEHGLHFIRRNIPPDHGFDLIAQPRRLLDSKPGTCSYVHAELSSVHAWEEILPKEEHDSQRRRAEHQEHRHKHFAILETGFQCALIALAHALETTLEAVVHAAKDVRVRSRLMGVVLMAFQQVHYQRGHQRSRK